MKTLTLQVVTPEATRLRIEQVTAVRVTLDNGPICILPGHASLIGRLAPGGMSYVDQKGDHRIEVEEGILRVLKGGVTVLTGSARLIS